MMKDNDHGLKEGEVEFTPLNENKLLSVSLKNTI